MVKMKEIYVVLGIPSQFLLHRNDTFRFDVYYLLHNAGILLLFTIGPLNSNGY